MNIKSGIPINLDNLIHRRIIENDRVEYKATWNDDIKQSVIRTVCAFANDLLNNNGGYIILGIEEQGGKPKLPPRGLDDLDIDKIQREIIGNCKGNIMPEYLPQVFVEQYQERTILVIWASAGENRPYDAPMRAGRGKTYWVRSGAATVEATGDIRRQLMAMAAKIPFDDRRSLTGKIEDISPILVKRFLRDIRSELASMDVSPEEIYEKMKLVVPMNEHKIPRNVALLFFSDDPEEFFRCARIEVVQFGDDLGGDLIEEKAFQGPLIMQIRSCLNYLNGLGGALLRKIPGQAEVERTVPYPYGAMEEAIVNAVYHKSYEYPPEPVKVYLYPDRMEITSYPGPVPGIRQEHLQAKRVPTISARNRRIGEFLKDLRLAEGRGTGIPKIQRKMKENGSPEATFEFDEDRTYFTAILPVHPRYQVLHAIREASHLWVIGSKKEAADLLERAFNSQPGSGILARQLIEYAIELEDLQLARQTMAQFENQSRRSDATLPYIAMAKSLLYLNHVKEAHQVLERMPPVQKIDDTVETAILKKKARDFQGAHILLEKAYSIAPDNPKILHEFAQTKIKLAETIQGENDFKIKKRLHLEAVELLRKAIQLADNSMREAWCWLDLAAALDWLKVPISEVEAAFLRAQSLQPDDEMFLEAYKQWQEKNKS